MSRVEEIESALGKLSLAEKQSVRDWLDDLIEDQLEVSDEFKGKIHRAQQEIADGVYSARASLTRSEGRAANLFAGLRR